MSFSDGALLLTVTALVGCGSDPVSSGAEPAPRAPEVVAEAIGAGDGSPASVSLVVVYEPLVARVPTALAWNPARPSELWVTLQEPGTGAPCLGSAPGSAACNEVDGKMAIIRGANRAGPEAEVKVDGNAWHFMRRPTSIAFAPNGLFATCGDSRSANYDDDANPYTGPVLWDSNPAIFGATPGPGMNGTHIDMLHATPYCMGIAHEGANVYWVFNGDVGALDRYDFRTPHAPGEEFHGDGAVWRYAEDELLRVPGVPSHLAYDAGRGRLYVADTGHGRVLALDTTSGAPGGEIPNYDFLETAVRMDGARVSEVIPPGSLVEPSGLTLHEGVLFVTDRGTGRIVAFEPNGALLRELDTGLSPDSLAGIAIGPDDKAYIVDTKTGRVYRIDK